MAGQRPRQANARRLEDRLVAEQARLGEFYRSILNAAGDGIIALLPDGSICSWSRGAERIFGYTEEEVKGRNASFLTAMQPLLVDDGRLADCALHWEGVQQHKDGTPVEVSIEVSSVIGNGGSPLGIVWVVRDIGSQLRNTHLLQLREERLQQEAHTDLLTGVANRRRLQQVLEAEIGRACRGGGTLSVTMADLDDLKSINDQYGHATGDAALLGFTRVIQAQLRACDLLARYGGDEFVIVMPDASAAEAVACANRMGAAISETRLQNLPAGFTCSFGIAEHHNADDAAAILYRADQALYLAKRNGRNCARHWTDEL